LFLAKFALPKVPHGEAYCHNAKSSCLAKDVAFWIFWSTEDFDVLFPGHTEKLKVSSLFTIFMKKVGFYQEPCWKFWGNSFLLICNSPLRFFSTILVHTLFMLRSLVKINPTFSLFMISSFAIFQPTGIYHIIHFLYIYVSYWKCWIVLSFTLCSIFPSVLKLCNSHKRPCFTLHKLPITFCKCQWHFSPFH